jgi:hypothetical protein
MLAQEQLQEYQESGYLVIEGFMSSSLCQDLKQECTRIIDSNFLDELTEISSFESKDENAEVFIFFHVQMVAYSKILKLLLYI